MNSQSSRIATHGRKLQGGSPWTRKSRGRRRSTTTPRRPGQNLGVGLKNRTLIWEECPAVPPASLRSRSSSPRSIAVQRHFVSGKPQCTVWLLEEMALTDHPWRTSFGSSSGAEDPPTRPMLPEFDELDSRVGACWTLCAILTLPMLVGLYMEKGRRGAGHISSRFLDENPMTCIRVWTGKDLLKAERRSFPPILRRPACFPLLQHIQPRIRQSETCQTARFGRRLLGQSRGRASGPGDVGTHAELWLKGHAPACSATLQVAFTQHARRLSDPVLPASLGGRLPLHPPAA